MKKLYIFLTLLTYLGVTQESSAQCYFYNNKYYDNPVVYEIGVSAGAMNCLTDIGGQKGIGKKFIKDLNLGNTQLSGGIFFNVMIKKAVGIRLEGILGQIKAKDSDLENVKTSTYGRYDRNLSFKSRINEFSFITEIHPLYIFVHYDEDKYTPSISPYLLGGIGLFHFNPMTKYENNWVDLQPLRTEGQGFAEYPDRKPYSLRQINIPVGLGAKYELSPIFNIRAEFVHRILFTDYLDDVSKTYINPGLYSNYFNGTKLANALLLNDRQYELNPAHITNPGDQRGNPKNNDTYFSFNIKISMVLGRKKH